MGQWQGAVVSRPSLKNKVLAASAVILPPLLIFGWMLYSPFTLGQDFQDPQIRQALLLRFYTSLGIEPLWAHQLTGGIPFYGLAMAQAFHLPAWLLSLLPGYGTGGMLTGITIKGIFLLMGGHALAWFALRRLSGLSRVVCYLLSFLSIYNLRVLDSFRYGTALDAFIYSQSLILVILLWFKEKRPSYAFAAMVLTQFTLTAGYPPLYPFAAVALLCCLCMMVFSKSLGTRDVLKGFPVLALAVGAGILLAAPSWLQFSEWLAVNHRRMLHSDLAWANFQPLDPVSLVSNFFRPWGAEVHSAFGGTTLLGLFFGALVVLCFLNLKRSWPVLLVLLFPFAYAVGAKSPVFIFFFKYIPLFSNTRVPGRVLVILPLLLLVAGTVLFRERTNLVRAFRISAIVSAGGLAASFWFGPRLAEQTPENLSQFWSFGPQMLWLVLGLAACSVFPGAGLKSPRRWSILIAVTFVQALLVLQNGTWIADRKPTVTFEQLKSKNYLPLSGDFENLAVQGLEESTWGSATIPFTRFVKSGDDTLGCFYPLPFYLSDNLLCRASEDAVLEEISRTPCSKALRTYVTASSCKQDLPGAGGSLVAMNQSNRIVTLTPNQLEMDYDSPHGGVFVTAYPWVKNWKGWVDGVSTELRPVNGTFVGVDVPAGRHLIRIQYSSALAIWSYRLFLAGLILVVGCIAWMGFGRYRRNALIVWALISVTLVAFFPAWTIAFESRAEKKLLLNHDYAAKLETQLLKWKN